MATLGTLGANSSANAFDHAKLAEQARTAFVLPGYQKFGHQIARLKKNIGQLCVTPSRANLSGAQTGFHQTIAVWGRIEIVTFGPIAQNNRFERIFFWPDRKSIGRRQVERLLRTKAADVVDSGSLAKKSVAVQGLSALEFLLFGNAPNQLASAEPKSHRCRYALAICENLSRIVIKIIAAWSKEGEFAKLWRSPGANNPSYLTPAETTLELVKAFDQTLEMVRDQRIAPPIGMGANRRVMRPVLWHSGFGMVLIHANLTGARDLLNAGGLAAAYVNARGQSDQATSAMTSIDSEFKLLLRGTAELAKTPTPFDLPDIRQRLVAIGFPMKNVRFQAVNHIKQAAGLSIGFNASDGD